MAIRIITDSGSDIVGWEEVTVVPLSITYGEESFKDGVEITTEQFYHKLVVEKNIPMTSQPSPQQFADVFEEVKNAGDSAVVINISSALSGTYQSAMIAKDMVEYEEIYIVDSMTATAGQRILVDEAIRLAKNGETAQNIASKLDELKNHIQVYAAVDTLEYLYKGGRVSAASAGIGTLAKIKPIIEVSKEGKVEVIAKAIGRKRAAKQLVEMISATQIDTNYNAYYIYSYDEKNCQDFKGLLEEEGNLEKDTLLKELGPTIGTHTGPGLFGLVYVRK